MLPAAVFLLSFALLVLVLVIWQKRRNLQGPINEKEENQLPVRAHHPEEFVHLTYIYIAAWVIGKNARDTQGKITFAHAYLQQRFGKTTIETSDELTRALRNATNIRNVAAWIVRHMKSGKERVLLIDFLLDLSFSDGDIIDREVVAIARFAELTGISIRYVTDEIYKRRKIIYDHYGSDATLDLVANGTFFRRRALFHLELTESATQEDIRKAFRRLAAQLHPDKLGHVDDGTRQKAAERFIEIKEAYNFLRK